MPQDHRLNPDSSLKENCPHRTEQALSPHADVTLQTTSCWVSSVWDAVGKTAFPLKGLEASLVCCCYLSSLSSSFQQLQRDGTLDTAVCEDDTNGIRVPGWCRLCSGLHVQLRSRQECVPASILFSFLSFLFLIFSTLCMWVFFPECMSVYCIQAWCLQRPEEDVR